MRIETLAIVYQKPRILLGMKKVRFGKGKYNGFGGGLEEGETLLECVKRETFSEAGIKLIAPRKMGQLLFQCEGEEQDHQVHIYLAKEYFGKPSESDEMIPRWFNERKIPYELMWEDDKYWLPWLLEGKKFEGHFTFGLDSKINYCKLRAYENSN